MSPTARVAMTTVHSRCVSVCTEEENNKNFFSGRSRGERPTPETRITTTTRARRAARRQRTRTTSTTKSTSPSGTRTTTRTTSTRTTSSLTTTSRRIWRETSAPSTEPDENQQSHEDATREQTALPHFLFSPSVSTKVRKLTRVTRRKKRVLSLRFQFCEENLVYDLNKMGRNERASHDATQTGFKPVERSSQSFSFLACDSPSFLYCHPVPLGSGSEPRRLLCPTAVKEEVVFVYVTQNKMFVFPAAAFWIYSCKPEKRE